MPFPLCKKKFTNTPTITNIPSKFDFDITRNKISNDIQNNGKHFTITPNEIHTKTVDIASPHVGPIRIDDVLIPSRFVFLEFKGIHDSFYIGVNSIEFIGTYGQVVPCKNIMVDGEFVNLDDGNENDNQDGENKDEDKDEEGKDEEGKEEKTNNNDQEINEEGNTKFDGVAPAFPPNGWWAVSGNYHNLLFDLGSPTHVREVQITCSNPSATPRVISISDGYRMFNSTTISSVPSAIALPDTLTNEIQSFISNIDAEEKKEEGYEGAGAAGGDHLKQQYRNQNETETKLPQLHKYHPDCYIQLSGDQTIHPSKLQFRQSPHDKKAKMLSCDYIINFLNHSQPDHGFESFLSEDGTIHFVFYQYGLRSKAYQYYFGLCNYKLSRMSENLPTNMMRSPRSSSSGDSSSISSMTNEIEDVAQRAMTLEELRTIRSIIVSHCISNKWKSSHPTTSAAGTTTSTPARRLRPEDVTFYDLNEILIKPWTKKRNCSFKELYSSTPCKPKWYVSHWWGDKVLDFIQCCEYHAMMYDVDVDDATYWICAFSNRQHDLGSGLGKNKTVWSSIPRAMDAATDGVLLVVDPKAVAYNRIWVDFELYNTIKHDRKLDIVTFSKGSAHLLADSSLKNETPWRKSQRELHFPFDRVTKFALGLELYKGVSSHEIDKIRILNAVSENDDFEDRAVLDRIESGNELDEEYEADMEKFSAVDYALRSQFATKAWSSALAIDGHGVDNFYGHDLTEMVMNDLDRKSLVFDNLMGMENMNDVEFGRIVSVIGQELETLVINVAGCHNLTDECLTNMHLPDSLKKLSLNFGQSENITDYGIIELAEKIPKNVEILELDIAPKKLDDGSWESPRFNEHLTALADALPETLLDFSLTTALCGDENASAVLGLAKALPATLIKLHIDFKYWTNFSGEIATAIAGYLPMNLESLSLSVCGGDYWEDDDWALFRAILLKHNKLKEIKVFSSDLGQKGYYLQRKMDVMDGLKAMS